MTRRSKGSLLYSPEIGEDIAGFRSFLRGLISDQNEILRVVLHRAGSYQEYPRRLTSKGVCSGSKGSAAKSIVQLMDFSFEDLNSDGIEIDVRTVPESENFKGVYVVHDAVKETDLNEEAREYLASNTLRQVLDSFFAKDYGEGKERISGIKERTIFIELKVPKKTFRPQLCSLEKGEKDYVSQVVAEVDKGFPQAGGTASRSPASKRRVAFISFNFRALEYARELSENKGIKDRPYFYIAGTNRKIFGYSAALFFFKDIDALTPALSERIRKAEWLTGIWFDPLGIKNMARTFDRLNRDRRRLLEIYISTYKLKKKRFRRRFLREAGRDRNGHGGRLNNVKGLIFDIRKF